MLSFLCPLPLSLSLALSRASFRSLWLVSNTVSVLYFGFRLYPFPLFLSLSLALISPPPSLSFFMDPRVFCAPGHLSPFLSLSRLAQCSFCSSQFLSSPKYTLFLVQATQILHSPPLLSIWSRVLFCGGLSHSHTHSLSLSLPFYKIKLSRDRLFSFSFFCNLLVSFSQIRKNASASRRSVGRS